MNWNKNDGKIQIFKPGSRIQIDLVDMPNEQVFKSLFGPKSKPESVAMKWVIVNARKDGLTLRQVADLMHLSVARIRQIEENFRRRLQHRYFAENK